MIVINSHKTFAQPETKLVVLSPNTNNHPHKQTHTHSLT